MEVGTNSQGRRVAALGREIAMEIGIGTIIVILLVVVIVLMLRGRGSRL